MIRRIKLRPAERPLRLRFQMGYQAMAWRCLIPATAERLVLVGPLITYRFSLELGAGAIAE